MSTISFDAHCIQFTLVVTMQQATAVLDGSSMHCLIWLLLPEISCPSNVFLLCHNDPCDGTCHPGALSDCPPHALHKNICDDLWTVHVLLIPCKTQLLDLLVPLNACHCPTVLVHVCVWLPALSQGCASPFPCVSTLLASFSLLPVQS